MKASPLSGMDIPVNISNVDVLPAPFTPEISSLDREVELHVHSHIRNIKIKLP